MSGALESDHTAVQLVRVALESSTAVNPAFNTPVIPDSKSQFEAPRVIRATDHAVGMQLHSDPVSHTAQ